MSRQGPRRYAQVAVLAQLGRAGGLFTYGLTADLAPLITVGSLVRVPFTNRQFQAIVCAIEASTELPRVRDVAELLDPSPIITDHHLRLGRWISDYYRAPLSDVLGAMLPPGLGRKTVYFLEPAAEANGARLTPEQRLVVERVRIVGRTPLNDLVREMPHLGVEKAALSLVRRGILSRSAELDPPRVAQRLERIVSISEVGVKALQTGKGLERSTRQRDVLELVANRGEIPSITVSQMLPKATGHIAALKRKGFITVDERAASRLPIKNGRYPVTTPLRLSSPQAAALAALVSSIRAKGPNIYLLHGVTGSGKTEVYLQAIAECLRHGRQAVMMVPEISLTPQAVERVAGRFPGRVAVLHSKLSQGERLDEWQRIRHGEVDVVVGPRSALFAPLTDPGLIIVDEEHDGSYKQESSPRYNARDAAAVWGRLTRATVVFGSATPDISTYHAASTGRIKLLELPDRPVWNKSIASHAAPVQANKAAAESVTAGSNGEGREDSALSVQRVMPLVEVVDLRQELKYGNRSIFSRSLLDALEQALEKHQQSLLFLNRRGSATSVVCRDCGFVLKCPNCDTSLTYHSAYAKLVCHRCDTRAHSPQQCPECGSARIRYLGVGTQRVQEEVSRLFPNARVIRWDRDVTSGKDAHDRILRQFANHEADVLVGTQMIAKGLDFPLVTVVGVVLADSGLHMPDFRSPERTFQLLTQVSGRAGRGDLESRVVVQTYSPDHYAIQAAKNHDYARFYREEMSFRQVAHYPPFARLTRLVHSSLDEAECQAAASKLRVELVLAIEQGTVGRLEIIGPAPCFVARLRNRYYWQIIIRAEGEKQVTAVHSLLDHVPAGWTIDVDPADLL